MYVEEVEDSIINFSVHSTVYTIYVKDVEDVEMYMYLFQEYDPDKNKSWFKLGAILVWKLWTMKRSRQK